ncbi:hypothetical protein ACFWIQ_08105 [Kitasatospora sp. NPDC127059]|uniref:hypothetical protein n=1 Tax=unclassified Kitasatospora TaxID=2633591 RepID=UPI00364B90D9
MTAVFALGWLFLAVIQNSYRSMNEGWSQAQGDRLIYLPMLGPAAAAVLVLLVVLITPARRWGLRATVALAGLGAVLGWLSELADWLFLTAR